MSHGAVHGYIQKPRDALYGTTHDVAWHPTAHAAAEGAGHIGVFAA